ncbi:alpha/beta hydrolase [Actinomadura craniellae]|uniref:alpha/beta hydrolase n=1 Tax=Actinomadura craniellae TaxID=2231787 RepID=UPI001F3CC971|nr:alpha/beta hydrolase [Actinomadura craniellae]
MRKVLVFGTALAATCIASLLTPPGSAAAPLEPTPTPGGTVSAVPSPPPPEVPAPPPDVASGEAVQVTPPPPHRRTFAYGTHPRQQLDVYWRTSPTEGARPAVLLLHGGAWRQGSKNGWSYIAGRLTQLGYVAIAPNYRLSQQAVWPAQRDDVQSALLYVKQNAARWGVDPDRIVAVGSSAGGHLATMLGTFGTGGEQVRGVVAMSPVNSPYLSVVDGNAAGEGGSRWAVRNAAIELVGCTPADSDLVCLSRFEDASSTTYASAGDAPMLLMHSTDEFVPVTHSTGLADALNRVGVKTTVRTYPGKAHGVGIVSDEAVFLSVVRWIDSVAKS